MNAKAESPSSAADYGKWFIAAVIVVASIYGYYYFADQAYGWVRMLGVLAALAVAGFVASTTAKGRGFLDFMRSANIERQKVVWPTRAETMQTTFAVGIVVLIVGILIWLLDWVFSSLIGVLVG